MCVNNDLSLGSHFVIIFTYNVDHNIVLLMLREDNTFVLYHQQQHEHNYEITHNLTVHDLSILTLIPRAFIPIVYSCYTPY